MRLEGDGQRLGDPSLDVVVLTWNDGPLLEEALESARGASGVNVNLIVVDNGSDPPAEARADTSLRNDVNAGVAAGRNQGVRAGLAPYVCLLDSDARLLPDALRSMVDALDRDDRMGLAVPVFVGQLPSASAGAAPTLLRKVARALGLTSLYSCREEFIDGVRAVDFGIGACQVFKRAAYASVGGLDETYFYGPEDVDFCLRLKSRGWRICQVESAGVIHPPRRRNRHLLTRRGLAHASAVARHLWRHRAFGRAR